ncbi:hypothetical protein [Phycicoccus sonneratiae]|uniref:Uncharacterized protein n=1 Tax=Phycicoccus sonneratiae TaxID=2807628 RepID=A0ABS2CMN0_9MICO|nr:hypothetical protein [Phycicoccus sonneraticus]MBM6401129.1 hypothetical protein [Phycicoccus sonneraticus]
MTWTDPTGRTRTTHPPDRLDSTVLPDTGTDRPPPPTSHSPVLPDGPHSALEHHLEHAAACRVHVVHPAAAITYRAGPHQRHRRRPPSTDPPPF